MIGASKLVGRSRVRLWEYVKKGRLRSFRYCNNTLFPLSEIADFLDVDIGQLLDVAESERLPLWRCWDEDS